MLKGFVASSKATSGNAPAGTSNPIGQEAACHFNKTGRPGQRDFGFCGNMTKILSQLHNRSSGFDAVAEMFP